MTETTTVVDRLLANYNKYHDHSDTDEFAYNYVLDVLDKASLEGRRYVVIPYGSSKELDRSYVYVVKKLAKEKIVYRDREGAHYFSF